MTDLECLKGVGPKTYSLLNKLNIYTIEDLITHYPYRYEVLKNTGFCQALAITSILGAHLGIILLIYVLNKLKYKIDSVNEFNKSSIKRWFIRLPILILSGIFLILYFVIPKGSPLPIIIFFKYALPFFLTGFCIYFLGIYICIYFHLSNENIIKIS